MMTVSQSPPLAPSERERLGALVSVCLLTYNHAHVIEATLSSILEQTISGYEVIVSDDCSSDGTWEVILEMASRDPRIRPVRPPRNLGMAGNANFAARQSTRRYIALLHHDDVYRADLLEKWTAALERHPRASFVFNPYAVYGSDRVYEEPVPAGLIEGKWLLERYLFPRWGCLVRGTAMIRRSTWNAIGGMREQFGMLADVDLWMRLCNDGPIAYVAEPVIAVRHARPEGYPSDYVETAWSWRRYRLLCEIHAENRLAYFNLKSITGLARWWAFRVRLNAETTKWLVYAVVRRKRLMVLQSTDAVTRFDFWALRLFRWCLVKAATALPSDLKAAP